MSTLGTLIGWIPRILLYALAAVIQVAAIALIVYDRVGVLREGSEVLLQTRPVDPRDFLRGDYVVLNYQISRRLPEMGVRMAVGASAHDVLRLVLWE